MVEIIIFIIGGAAIVSYAKNDIKNSITKVTVAPNITLNDLKENVEIN